MANPHGDFVWYELATPDPDAAKAFYDPVVGWDIGPAPADGMDYRMIGSGGGQAGGVMRLQPEMEAGGARPGWLGYVGVADVDASVAKAQSEGGSVRWGPVDMPDVGRMALISDPAGLPIYVMRGASEKASTAFGQGTVGRCAWNELSTPDQPGALAFYERMFGWTAAGGMPMGELGEYTFLSHENRSIGAVMTTPPGGPSGWCFYFQVPDIDAAARTITERGGAIVQEPVEIPGGDYSLVATDPHGGVFGLVGGRTE